MRALNKSMIIDSLRLRTGITRVQRPVLYAVKHEMNGIQPLLLAQPAPTCGRVHE
jgi:hypothetical protein